MTFEKVLLFVSASSRAICRQWRDKTRFIARQTKFALLFVGLLFWLVFVFSSRKCDAKRAKSPTSFARCSIPTKQSLEDSTSRRSCCPLFACFVSLFVDVCLWKAGRHSERVQQGGSRLWSSVFVSRCCRRPHARNGTRRRLPQPQTRLSARRRKSKPRTQMQMWIVLSLCIDWCDMCWLCIDWLTLSLCWWIERCLNWLTNDWVCFEFALIDWHMINFGWIDWHIRTVLSLIIMILFVFAVFCFCFFVCFVFV